MNLPDIKPENPNFSSGPCSKRPNWSINNLEGALLGRSHRTPKCKDKLKEVINKSKLILGLPDDYHVGIMPGSDTGALEAAMFSVGVNSKSRIGTSPFVIPSSYCSVIVGSKLGLPIVIFLLSDLFSFVLICFTLGRLILWL